MTQILPAPPAPAPAARSSTASSKSNDGTSLGEFMAVLARALDSVLDGEVVDGEMTMADEAFDADATEDDESAELALALVSGNELLNPATEIASDTLLDGSVLDGAVLDGMVLDSTALDGTALDGAAPDGTALDGTAPIDGEVADPAVAELAAGSGPDLGGDASLKVGATVASTTGVAVDAARITQAEAEPAAVPTSARQVSVDGAEQSLPDAEAETVPSGLPPTSETTTAVVDDSALRAPTVRTAGVETTASTSPTDMASAPDPFLDGEDPWSQLATVIRPLRQMADGTHRLSLQLRPAELGAVHLEVTVEDGQFSVRAVAENIASRDVLAAAMPELREELTRSGIDVGSLDVGDHTSDGSTTHGESSDTTTVLSGRDQRSGGSRGSAVPAGADETSISPSANAPGRLDLSL